MKHLLLKNLTAALLLTGFVGAGVSVAHADDIKPMPMAMPATMPMSAAAKPAAKPATQASAEAAIKSAEDAAKQADTLGVNWTTVPTLLQAAHDADASGDFATAQKKAAKAEVQAKTAVAEAHEQTTLWRTQIIH